MRRSTRTRCDETKRSSHGARAEQRGNGIPFARNANAATLSKHNRTGIPLGFGKDGVVNDTAALYWLLEVDEAALREAIANAKQDQQWQAYVGDVLVTEGTLAECRTFVRTMPAMIGEANFTQIRYIQTSTYSVNPVGNILVAPKPHEPIETVRYIDVTDNGPRRDGHVSGMTLETAVAVAGSREKKARKPKQARPTQPKLAEKAILNRKDPTIPAEVVWKDSRSYTLYNGATLAVIKQGKKVTIQRTIRRVLDSGRSTDTLRLILTDGWPKYRSGLVGNGFVLSAGSDIISMGTETQVKSFLAKWVIANPGKESTLKMRRFTAQDLFAARSREIMGK